MKFPSILLAAAAAVTLAAPAAAFAQSWHGSDDGRGYGYDQSYGQGYGHYQAHGYGGRDRDHDGWRRAHCRRGVFYMRGNACSNDYGRGHDGWRGYDNHSRYDGSDHRRWR